MSSDTWQGIVLLCSCTGVPFLLGGVLAWRLRGRVQQYGMPGALLPRFIRERIL